LGGIVWALNVGKEFAHPDDHIAQLLTPVALLARHTADAVEHTVFSEQIDEPLDVQDITLR
jgi:TorA maturation chaperone TorD